MAGDDKKRKASGAKARGTGVARDEGAVGSALRAAYQNAVEEKIPDDLLDLLGKLN